MSKASLELGGGNWGTKDGNLLAYAQGNESSNLVPREFTFTRGSDIAATRINSSGLIEKYRENLLLQSNQFDTTWTLGGSTLLEGQSDKDGGTNAWKLTSSNIGNQSFVKQVVSSSGVATYSVYAKAGTANFIVAYAVGGGDPRTFFDLQNGTTETAANNITNKIEDVGNGWYRCSVIFDKTITDVRLFVADSDNVFNSGNGSSVYIQDAQLERGLVATSYLESGATTATSGVADNEPRIDYAGGTASLLLEPSRTNLMLQSEYFNFSGYTSFNSTINDNATTSPEGLINAAEIAGNGSSGQVFFRENLGVPSVGNYTFSLFAKYKNNSDATNLMLNITDFGDGNGSCFFDIEDGVKGTESGVTGNIEDYGNGWYRCSITTNITDGTDLSGRMQFYAANSSEGLLFSPNNANADLYIYGMQLEQASYPTSYIPTYGTSDTRAADGQTLDITNLISSTEGTLFFHLKDAKSHSQTNKILGIGDGSGVDNFFGLYVNDFQTGAVGIRNRQANADLMNTAIPNPQNAKVAIKFSPSGVKTFLNGLEFQSSATAYTGWATSFDLNTTVGDVDLKQYLLFNEALTDAECIALTTL